MPPQRKHLDRVADFLEAVDPLTGQTTLFPYQFDVIPVELISSIYEQFAHSQSAPNRADIIGKKSEAANGSVHYTRLPAVSLVLDEVMDGLRGDETVLDLTCGSGVFLVEALRRFVRLRTRRKKPTRELIRSILHRQLYGVDISEAAIHVAAFSLYLAALECDPDPQSPEGLKFEPLIGRTLINADAHNVEKTPKGAALLDKDGERKRFDLVVGNPPWTFRGQVGSKERRRNGKSAAPLQPRGESLDFVARALDFAHEKTRLGMLLSAMPFFSGSNTGLAAVQPPMRQLAPVTLVNLANMHGWLFPTAAMPAVALFGRHRTRRPGQITVVQVPWSPASAKTHTFDIAPSDIITIPVSDWDRNPRLLKAAAVGHRRDMLLLEGLSSHRRLEDELRALDVKIRDGLIAGNKSRDAAMLQGLPWLQTGDLKFFGVPDRLPPFGLPKAEGVRSRETYTAPLLLVKEFVPKGGRAMTAVSDRDLVFTDAYYGASFPAAHRDAAYLLAGLLGSALGSWFFLTTAAEFGLWKRRLLLRDVQAFPTPPLASTVRSKAGMHVLAAVDRLVGHGVSEADWKNLDEAVFDLYGLDGAERVVVRDGLIRAGWQWRAGRERSVQPAETAGDLGPYASTFVAVMDNWLAAAKRRRMRAEVFDLPKQSPLRIVRFVIEDRRGPSHVKIVRPYGELASLIDAIGQRLNVRLATSLVGKRELRVHGRNEVVIIKPAARRHWMSAAALEDADAVVAESVTGAAA
ncbi:MAG: Eco57I restriction-modification methylase domain-containing protein [Hyphomicrobiaceae bacterium]